MGSEMCIRDSVVPEDEWIDIGITMACVPARFEQFLRVLSLEQREKWAKRVRFIIVEYDCKDPSKRISLPETIVGFPLVKRRTSRRFSRASNVNMLMKMTRPRSRFLVVDVDMLLSDEALEHVIKYVKPGVAYFPIVWSRFSPHGRRVVSGSYTIRCACGMPCRGNACWGRWRGTRIM